MMKSNRTGPKYKNPNGPITPQYLHLGYLGHHIAIDTTPHPVGTVYAALPRKSFLPGGPLQLVDGYYSSSSRFQETFELSSTSLLAKLQPSSKLPLRKLTPLRRGVSNGCMIWVSRGFGTLQCQPLTSQLIFLS